LRKHYRNSQVQGEPNKQTFVSGDIKLCCLITIKNPFKIILFLCCRRILVRSATFDSHPAARSSSSTWQVKKLHL